MKVTVERAALLKSLSHVHRIVERRNTIPILANVLIRTDDDAIKLKATDLDIEVVEKAAADVGQAGATTVPAYMIYDIVRKLPEDLLISLETSEGRATLALRAGRSRFRLQTLPETGFPDLAAGEMTHKFTLPARDIKRLIDKTQFAISTEGTRYYLNGIYLHTVGKPGQERVRAVATNDHMLAQVDLQAPAEANGMPGIIVPRKAVGEVQRLIEDLDANVAIELSSTKIRFTIGDAVLTSKLIYGTFPDYARVIPLGNNRKLEVDRQEFAAAVGRVSTILSKCGRAVKLSLTQDNLILSGANPGSGSATEELEAHYDSQPIDIGFNSHYLLEIVGQIEGDAAVLRLGDPDSPVLIQDHDAADSLYVLMPMRSHTR